MSEITYHCEGDYLIPDLIAPKSPEIGIWGYRRRKYLLKSKELLYTGLFLSGNLNAHLEEIDRAANELFDLLIKEYAAREGITEELKMKNHLEWVQHMNQIRAEADLFSDCEKMSHSLNFVFRSTIKILCFSSS